MVQIFIHLINIPTTKATGGLSYLLLQDVDQEDVSFNADEVERLESFMEAASNDLKRLKRGEVDHISDEMLSEDDDWILETTKIKDDGSTEDVNPISIITIEDGAVLTPVRERFSLPHQALTPVGERIPHHQTILKKGESKKMIYTKKSEVNKNKE